jgi:hypothetical protein
MLLVDDVLNSKTKVLQPLFSAKSAFIHPLAVLQGEDLPRAASFIPTLSIALSNALPMRNSRERSTYYLANYHKGDWDIRAVAPTIDPLLVGEGLTLLRLIPFNDQTISESERGARICRPG